MSWIWEWLLSTSIQTTAISDGAARTAAATSRPGPYRRQATVSETSTATRAAPSTTSGITGTASQVRPFLSMAAPKVWLTAPKSPLMRNFAMFVTTFIVWSQPRKTAVISHRLTQATT